ncbi:MFS transporter [Parvularcula sp. IMCC14364]|uniref:AmpG family muropeptide MFS transporter n=1 Tax=Parvularcula sp. IMCC14364 TaxID=3067902 RepID=UPI0027428E88|nr:MFS transporter [Parvularcula sp. IMCC14364]
MTEELTAPQKKTVAGTIASWIEPYKRPEMAAMLLLGFVSGLPLYLVNQKTSYWLRLEGIERSTIGFFYWVGLAYSFKFIWAPIIDKLTVPALGPAVGHRRSWMMVAIAGTVMGLLIIATADPSESIWPVTFGAILLAFSGATLDVSIDAWRIGSAPTERQANMAASYSLGYRGALIFSGLGFVVADFANWNLSFTFMALSMAACAFLILFIKEPDVIKTRQSTDHLPLLAGPPNAIAAGVAFFVMARILTWFGIGTNVVQSLFVVGAIILALGPIILRATKTPFLNRLIIIGLGGLFVFSRDLVQALTALPDDSRWLSLFVILANLLAVGCLIWLVAFANTKQDAGSEPVVETNRGKLYVMFGTPLFQVYERLGLVLVPILVLVMIYRLSDFTMGVMAIPLYADLGYAPAMVGGIQSGPGVASIIIGLFIGGIVAQKMGVMRAMIVGAGLTLLTNGAYAWFAATAETSPDVWRLALAICADNVAGGFVTTVFIAYLSSLVDPAYAATQYALFSSLYALLNKFVAGFSGLMADAVGYVAFFLITASYTIPAALLVILVMTLQGPPPERAAESSG